MSNITLAQQIEVFIREATAYYSESELRRYFKLGGLQAKEIMSSGHAIHAAWMIYQSRAVSPVKDNNASS